MHLKNSKLSAHPREAVLFKHMKKRQAFNLRFAVVPSFQFLRVTFRLTALSSMS